MTDSLPYVTSMGTLPRLLVSLLLALPTVVSANDKATDGPYFREIAGAVGLDFVHFNGMVGRLYFPEMMGGGVALLDYDDDGDLDVYLGQGSLFEGDHPDELVYASKYPFPLTDRLYRNDLEVGEDGSRTMRFVDVTEKSGLEATTGYNMGVATGDYDNDGDVDLYLTNLAGNHLLRNNGDGTFSEVVRRARADDREWSVAASFFDFDRDGWLDLFVGNYLEWRMAIKKRCSADSGRLDYCGPLSYLPLPNRLFLNDRAGAFDDVTGVALSGSVPSSTLGALAADFDRNGFADLYVANDLRPNELWMNGGNGALVDEALLAGVSVNARGEPQSSMGVVVGDLDADGDDDLFLTHWRGDMNTTYLNDGGGQFEDRSGAVGLGRPSVAFTGFGTALFDFDNSGTADLFVANGAVSLLASQVRVGDEHPLRERNQLFRGLGSGRFEEVPAERWVDVTREEVSRGVACGDLDNDGDADLVVSNNAGPVRLLSNQVGNRHPWVGVRLLFSPGEREGAARDAIGAVAELRRRDKPTLHRRVHTDGSYVSAGDPRLLFGLGPGEPALDRLLVRWPDGSHELFRPEALVVGGYVTLRQGEGRPAPAE